MKIDKEVKNAAMIILGLALGAMALSTFSGCAKEQAQVQAVQGPAGPQGPVGATGSQGLGAGIQVTNATTCPNGGINVETFTDVYNTGTFAPGDLITSLTTVCNGVAGAQGVAGQSGENGDSFQVSQTAATVGECSTGGVVYTTSEKDGNGNLIPGSTTQAVVCNGQVGATGATGPSAPVSAYQPVAMIQPCGAASSSYKETLVGLSGGYVLSEFTENSSTDYVRNTLLPDGNYLDTDDSECNFTVSTDNKGDRTIAWAAQTCANGYVATAGSIVYTASTGTWSGSN